MPQDQGLESDPKTHMEEGQIPTGGPGACMCMSVHTDTHTNRKREKEGQTDYINKNYIYKQKFKSN